LKTLRVFSHSDAPLHTFFFHLYIVPFSKVLHTLNFYIMAETTTKTTVIVIPANTDATAFQTAVNTALASYDGSGVAGAANQGKFVQGINYSTVFDGTDINYSACITVVDTNAAVA
jgi:hypothetical protein